MSDSKIPESLLFQPSWGGSASRNASSEMNRLGELGDPFFFLVDFRGRFPLVLNLDQCRQRGISFSLPGFPDESRKIPQRNWLFQPIPFSVYDKAFHFVQSSQREGNSYLANLTFASEVKCDYSLEELYFGAAAPYRLLFRDRFVCFSPEGFVRIKNGRISSFPMKGTLDASITDALDLLINDEKEKAEHTTIVDLIRNDLGRVASDITVENYRYAEKIPAGSRELYQISSVISGKLADHYQQRIGDLIFSLLPAGSVTGAPKKKTVEILLEAEKTPRGYYTGVFGYFDGENLESGVLIRFLEKSGNKLFYRSGSGLTIYSDCSREYSELKEKIYAPIC